jgi:hypothetical protein
VLFTLIKPVLGDPNNLYIVLCDLNFNFLFKRPPVLCDTLSTFHLKITQEKYFTLRSWSQLFINRLKKKIHTNAILFTVCEKYWDLNNRFNTVTFCRGLFFLCSVNEFCSFVDIGGIVDYYCLITHVQLQRSLTHYL